MPLKGGKINHIIRGQQGDLQPPPGEHRLNREVLKVHRLGPGNIMLCTKALRLPKQCIHASSWKEDEVKSWVRSVLPEYGYTEKRKS